MYDICTQNFSLSSNLLVINITLKAKYRLCIDHADIVYSALLHYKWNKY